MKREKELVKNTLILSIGRFLPRLFGIITLPIVTGHLTKVEYGTYDLVTSLVSLVFPIATLQIGSAAFRFLIDCRGDKQREGMVITNILAVTIPTSIIAIIGLLVYLHDQPISTRILISLYFFVDIYILTIQQIVRGLSYNKCYSVSSVLNSAFFCMTIIATLLIRDDGLNGVLAAHVIGYFAAQLYLSKKINLHKYIKRKYLSIKTIKELVSYSWPMIPNNLSSWVLKMSDRFVILSFIGVEANAVYAVANKIPNLFTQIQGVFIMAWQENASIVSKDEDATEYYSKMFESTFRMLSGIMSLMIAATPIMFELLIKGDYADAYIQIPILYMAVFFSCMSSFQGGIYIAYKRTKSVGITTIIAAVCNLLVDLLLVNAIGITAGSISSLVSYIFLYLYRLFDVQKIQKIHYNFKLLVGGVLLLCVMCMICCMQNIYLNIVNILIGVAFAILLNVDIIKATISQGRRYFK